MVGEMSYSMEELSAQSGIPPRTIRYYIQMGLLTAPEPRGRYTRYEALTLPRLHAVRALRDSGLPLDEIRARVDGRTEAELSALAKIPPVPAAPAPVAPPKAPVARSPRPAPPPPVVPAAPPVSPRGAARWTRTVLVPGLEIHVREDAGPLVDRLAPEIVAAYSLPPTHEG